MTKNFNRQKQYENDNFKGVGNTFKVIFICELFYSKIYNIILKNIIYYKIYNIYNK